MMAEERHGAPGWTGDGQVWLRTRVLQARAGLPASHVQQLRQPSEVGCRARFEVVGAGSRNRTHDQRFTKPLLYQLSYAGPVKL
jgi:hypothetical protein